MTEPAMDAFHHPRSVAVFGASDSIDKVGGRPIHYLKSLGFAGTVYPINPSRSSVQDLAAFADVALLPEVPDVAVIAVPGQGAVDAVRQCAEAGVKGCVILSSGFAEAREAVGIEMQEEMVRIAGAAGMRLVGPNAQGLANFGNGAVLAFSTMFIEAPPMDGPVALVSQSGGMSAIPYGLLRDRGVGVRYCHGSGNDCDVNVSELVSLVLQDPDVKVVLMYVEGIADAADFERAARASVDKGIPIVALVGGRSSDGARAAQSHTGSLASEAVVVEAFLERLGVRSVKTMTELVQSVDLYLTDAEVSGEQIGIISNSGGVCVLASDHASDYALPLATFDARTVTAISAALPAFASVGNPVDITGALLRDSLLVRNVLDAIDQDSGGDIYLLSLPVSGRGYDTEEFAAAAHDFAVRIKRPFAVVTPQPRAAEIFRSRGLAVYADEADAVRALAGYVRHIKSMERARGTLPLDLRRPSTGATAVLNEAQGLAVLGSRAEIVEHVLVATAAEAAAAFGTFGGRPVVVKGCTSSVSHKSEYGLVDLGCSTSEEVADAAARILEAMSRHGFEIDGLLVEPLVNGAFEVMVGAHRDAGLGAVVIVGAGGKYIEATPDFAMLVPPFGRDEAIRAIHGLRMAPLLEGVRGEAPVDLEAWADLVVAAGDLVTDPESTIESLDANPVLLVREDSKTRAVVADAVIVTAERDA